MHPTLTQFVVAPEPRRSLGNSSRAITGTDRFEMVRQVGVGVEVATRLENSKASPELLRVAHDAGRPSDLAQPGFECLRSLPSGQGDKHGVAPFAIDLQDDHAAARGRDEARRARAASTTVSHGDDVLLRTTERTSPQRKIAADLATLEERPWRTLVRALERRGGRDGQGLAERLWLARSLKSLLSDAFPAE